MAAKFARAATLTTVCVAARVAATGQVAIQHLNFGACKAVGDNERDSRLGRCRGRRLARAHDRGAITEAHDFAGADHRRARADVNVSRPLFQQRFLDVREGGPNH